MSDPATDGASFTPGPWVIYPETNGTEICAVDLQPRLPVRQIIARPVMGENWIANARLIAAAPDLLEALGYVLATLKAQFPKAQYEAMEVVQLADRALEKARG